MSAQNISGVINSYAKVLTVDDCGETLKVRSDLNQTNFAPHFAAAKRILIMQMQGAIIPLDDDASFGVVEEYTQAGYFEFAEIDAVTYISSQVIGSTTWYDYEVAVDAALQHWYDPSQSVQIVSVPVYATPTITGTITADAWDPAAGTGGVVVLEAAILIMNADIDVSGQGFSGGAHSGNGSTTGEFGFLYTQNTVGQVMKAGKKGDGIAAIDKGWASSGLLKDRRGGRGRAANGGGGGNARNAGGGGGGNAGHGGKGGNQVITSGKAAIGGLGGSSYKYTVPLDRVFMGGGGGGGQQNDDSDAGASTAGDGGAGGGIVIITAGEIVGTGYKIKANGSSGDDGNGDGAGGGGAGGCVLLDVGDFDDNIAYDPDLTIEANGGSGGDAVGTTTECHGPGGGGGGGLVWFSLPSKASYPNVKVNDDNATTGAPGLLGGAAGAPTNCTDPDVNATNGAQPGTMGALLFNLVLP